MKGRLESSDNPSARGRPRRFPEPEKTTFVDDFPQLSKTEFDEVVAIAQFAVDEEAGMIKATPEQVVAKEVRLAEIKKKGVLAFNAVIRISSSLKDYFRSKKILDMDAYLEQLVVNDQRTEKIPRTPRGGDGGQSGSEIVVHQAAAADTPAIFDEAPQA